MGGNPNDPPPLNYATDDPVEEVPRFRRAWAGAGGIGVLLAAAALGSWFSGRGGDRPTFVESHLGARGVAGLGLALRDELAAPADRVATSRVGVGA